MSGARFRRIVLGGWLAGATVGCAGAPPAPDHGHTAGSGGGPGVPSGPPASSYVAPTPNSEREGHDRGRDALKRALEREVVLVASAARIPAPVRDARLDRVADDVARASPASDLPSFDLVAFLLGHYGIVEPEPSLVVVRGSGGADQALLDHLRPQLPALLRQGAWGRLGIGIHRGAGDMVLVLALQDQPLGLNAIPRALPATGYAKLAGRLLRGHGNPHMLVTGPSGLVRDVPVRTKGPAFEANFACVEGRGRYQVEITGSDARGPAVLANFSLFCGIAPDPLPPAVAFQSSADPVGASTEEIARALFDLVNQDRAAAGLAPVRWDARLAAIAREHSQEMADSGVVAHVSPASGSAADRVLRAGLRPMIVSENVGRAYSASQAQRGFMASPGHRANVIDPRVMHLGVGVVRGPAETGVVPLFFTQLYSSGLSSQVEPSR